LLASRLRSQPCLTLKENHHCPPVDWVEGVAILVAILIVVLIGSLNDWQKEKQFKALNEKREEHVVKVIRVSFVPLTFMFSDEARGCSDTS